MDNRKRLAKLNHLERAELERLEKHKEALIYEMMGACNEINEEIKAVKNGSWYNRYKAYLKDE